MPRISIQRFRALLAARAGSTAAVSAYREVSHRPEVALTMAAGDWLQWTRAPSSAA